MSFVVFGTSHKVSPIHVREKVFLTSAQQDFLLSELRNLPQITQACVLSTCNRTEIYAFTIDNKVMSGEFIQRICKVKNIPYAPQLLRYFYHLFNEEGIAHLFKVAAGLDSLVLGEDQILGQVKTAFDKARGAGMFDRRLNILSHLALEIGRKARRETDIGLGGSSISWAAIVKAENMLGDLKSKSILIIGAGKMSELAVGHIQSRKFKKLYLMNRTHDAAVFLASQYGAQAVPFYDLKEVLSEVELCVCSAGAPHYLVERDIVRRVMDLRHGRPLIFIDISMPRNIDPEIKNLPDVQLVELDDLKEVVESNLKIRRQAVSKVHQMIDDKVVEYFNKLKKSPHIEQINIL